MSGEQDAARDAAYREYVETHALDYLDETQMARVWAAAWAACAARVRSDERERVCHELLDDLGAQMDLGIIPVPIFRKIVSIVRAAEEAAHGT